MINPLSTPDLLVISHSGARAGAPMVLLRLLRWLEAETQVDTEVLLLHGGSMEGAFEAFDAKILGGAESRLWMIQRGFTNLGLNRAAGALAFARLAPTMWAKRGAPLVLLNSVGSLPALQFLPAGFRGTKVLYVHELDGSFEGTVGSRVWDRLSPRVDHYISCSRPVTEMLVERKGIDPDRISEHPGFVDPDHVEPLRLDRLRHELGIAPDALVVGASGRPDWRKAPDLFVRLARSLCDRLPDRDIQFIWLGGPIDDSAGWKVIHDVQAAGLSGRFHLTGETRRPAEIMALFDVFALTSREDPFPLAMLEAAGLGVPVVAFANGGVEQFARSGGDLPVAEVVSYLDVAAMTTSVARLLEDPAERSRLGRRGRQQVRDRHLTERSAPELFETLARLEPRLGAAWDGPRPTAAIGAAAAAVTGA